MFYSFILYAKPMYWTLVSGKMVCTSNFYQLKGVKHVQIHNFQTLLIRQYNAMKPERIKQCEHKERKPRRSSSWKHRVKRSEEEWCNRGESWVREGFIEREKATNSEDGLQPNVQIGNNPVLVDYLKRVKGTILEVTQCQQLFVPHQRGKNTVQCSVVKKVVQF